MSANDRLQATDLDRLLGEWLAEGPALAPQAPLTAARDHARAHPRRRDPLAFLRADPMPARGSGRTLLGMAPATAVAVVALLVATVAGAAWVGSQLDGTGPVLPPSPTTSPTPAASPSAVPTPRTWRVTLASTTAARWTVEVVDRDLLLADVRSGPAADGGSVTDGVLEVTNVDDRTLRLTWTDAVCSADYVLHVEEGPVVELRLEVPPCSGDAMAMDRVLDLAFTDPIAAPAVKAGLVDVP